ncbi:MAG: PKD domain-containing protein [Fidelibacterota bacterium]|nr:MAG: PKD domain-containing protein [Candidatus Neomarinimicrobiota bacterium]
MNIPATCFRTKRIWKHTSFCVLIMVMTLAGPAGAQVTGLDGAVSIWRLDQGFGTAVAENDIDQEFNGTIIGTRAWQAGMYGEALVFNGEDNAVEVASNPLIGAHALTIQAYIRPTGIPNEKTSKIFIIALEREAPGVDRFMLDMLPDDNVNNWVLSHFMSIADEGTDPELDLLESGTFHPWDQWYHVAMVFDSVAADSVRISHYVNHALEYTTRYQLDTLRGGEVFIGVRHVEHGDPLTRDYFEGLMDNVVLHARALTPPEFMPAPGTADFDADPRSGPPPLEVSFTDGSPGEVTSWSWDFGDGQAATNQHPTHTYTDPGTYSVTLVINGSLGLDTLTRADFIQATGDPIAVDEEFYGALPTFQLAQNYPNPFNPLTFIEYSLDTPQYVRLSIYNIDGQLVKLLDEGYKPAGTYLKVWYGRDEYGQRLSSGIYLYHLESALGHQRIKKAIFMK